VLRFASIIFTHIDARAENRRHCVHLAQAPRIRLPALFGCSRLLFLLTPIQLFHAPALLGFALFPVTPLARLLLMLLVGQSATSGSDLF
jgi:hypothetical protein